MLHYVCFSEMNSYLDYALIKAKPLTIAGTKKHSKTSQSKA